MKKVVLKVELYDDKVKQKVMKTVSGLSGVESIAMDMKEKKLTVTGDVDPVTLVAKLRKLCHTEIVTVGPAKEPEKKKEEPKKEEAKKQAEPKKEEAKKQVEAKKEEPKKQEEKKQKESNDDGPQIAKAIAYPAYTQHPYYHQHPPPPPPPYYHHHQHPYYQQPPAPPHYYQRSMEEDPNSCVIC